MTARRPTAAPDSADATFAVHPIGVVRSPFRVHVGTPRQPGVAPIADGEIVLRAGLQNCLKDLKGFSHLWVLFWCNFSRGWNAQVVPPRDTVKRGLFATRSPHRPNPIGLSVVQLLDVRGTRLRVRGLDMLEGTPVLDLKPYVRYADSRPDASDGWLAELPPEPLPDHRDWQATPSNAKRSRRALPALLLATTLLGSALLPGCAPDAPSKATESTTAPPLAGPAPGQATIAADATTIEGDGVLDAWIAPPSKGDEAGALPWFQQAIAQRGAFRSRSAVRAFEKALELDPAHLGALVEYGFLLLEPGAEQNFGLALLQFRRAQLVVEGQLHAMVGEGVARAALNDVARAESLLRHALEKLPESAIGRRAWAAIALGDVCANDGRQEEALALYRQASGDAIPALQRGVALVRLADLQAQLDRPTDALATVRRALAVDPENVRAHYLLAQLLTKSGDAEGGAKEARIHELLRSLRDHLSTRYVNDAARRTALWRELATAWPEHRRLLHSLVRDQLEGGDFVGAKGTAAEIEARDGASAEVHWLAARALAGCGDLDGAKQRADAMQQLDPGVPPGVLRTVLDDWRRGNPETVDATAFDRALRAWLGGA